MSNYFFLPSIEVMSIQSFFHIYNNIWFFVWTYLKSVLSLHYGSQQYKFLGGVLKSMLKIFILNAKSLSCKAAKPQRKNVASWRLSAFAFTNIFWKRYYLFLNFLSILFKTPPKSLNEPVVHLVYTVCSTHLS